MKSLGINKLAHFAKYIIARLGVVVASAAATVTRAPARLFPRARSRLWFFDPENLRCPCSPPQVEPLYFQEWRNGVNNTNGGKPDKNEFNLIFNTIALLARRRSLYKSHSGSFGASLRITSASSASNARQLFRHGWLSCEDPCQINGSPRPLEEQSCLQKDVTRRSRGATGLATASDQPRWTSKL